MGDPLGWLSAAAVGAWDAAGALAGVSAGLLEARVAQLALWVGVSPVGRDPQVVAGEVEERAGDLTEEVVHLVMCGERDLPDSAYLLSVGRADLAGVVLESAGLAVTWDTLVRAALATLQEHGYPVTRATDPQELFVALWSVMHSDGVVEVWQRALARAAAMADGDPGSGPAAAVPGTPSAFAGAEHEDLGLGGYASVPVPAEEVAGLYRGMVPSTGVTGMDGLSYVDLLTADLPLYGDDGHAVHETPSAPPAVPADRAELWPPGGIGVPDGQPALPPAAARGTKRRASTAAEAPEVFRAPRRSQEGFLSRDEGILAGIKASPPTAGIAETEHGMSMRPETHRLAEEKGLPGGGGQRNPGSAPHPPHHRAAAPAMAGGPANAVAPANVSPGLTGFDIQVIGTLLSHPDLSMAALADLYHHSATNLKTWIRKLGERLGVRMNPAAVVVYVQGNRRIVCTAAGLRENGPFPVIPLGKRRT
ncbi:hypothetical protein [Streptomyces sp. NPDC051014]|uniref:hypothetical protein n=1 Tax=Streptomyces sp. NPDC051014 TaxID=3155751 RepID=UPI0033F2E00D